MKGFRSAKIILMAMALVVVFAMVAMADDELSAVGKVERFGTSSIVVNVQGETLTLGVNDETEILGEVKAGVMVYVEWKGDTAIYIEVEEGDSGEGN